jgi:hypothetical protein
VLGYATPPKAAIYALADYSELLEIYRARRRGFPTCSPIQTMPPNGSEKKSERHFHFLGAVGSSGAQALLISAASSELRGIGWLLSAAVHLRHSRNQDNTKRRN